MCSAPCAATFRDPALRTLGKGSWSVIRLAGDLADRSSLPGTTATVLAQRAAGGHLGGPPQGRTVRSSDRGRDAGSGLRVGGADGKPGGGLRAAGGLAA